jgi:hypothetical protein
MVASSQTTSYADEEYYMSFVSAGIWYYFLQNLFLYPD